MRVINYIRENYPVKRGRPAPPCKPYEVMDMIEGLERQGIIPKPLYGLKY
jgi:hypothetical protein